MKQELQRGDLVLVVEFNRLGIIQKTWDKNYYEVKMGKAFFIFPIHKLQKIEKQEAAAYRLG